MDFTELVIRRVQEKTGRYHGWLQYFDHPLVMTPGLVFIGSSPAIAMRLISPIAGLPIIVVWAGLYVYAASRSNRSWDLALGVSARPAWTAFCAAIQGRREFKYGHMHTKPMNRDCVDWMALVQRESQAYDDSTDRAGCQTKQDWVALRTLAFLFDETAKATVLTE